MSYMSEFHSFLKLNNVPLYVCTTFCLSIHVSGNTWVPLPYATVGSMGVQKSVQVSASILLCVDLEGELLDPIIILCLIF